jgi:hypothetical protein
MTRRNGPRAGTTLRPRLWRMAPIREWQVKDELDKLTGPRGSQEAVSDQAIRIRQYGSIELPTSCGLGEVLAQPPSNGSNGPYGLTQPRWWQIARSPRARVRTYRDFLAVPLAVGQVSTMAGCRWSRSSNSSLSVTWFPHYLQVLRAGLLQYCGSIRDSECS